MLYLKQRVSEMEDYPLEPSTKIGLFGAGYFAPFIVDYLQRVGCSVACCIDSFQTGMLGDVPIVSPTDERVSHLDIIFITTLPNAADISRQLLSIPGTRNIPHVHWDKFFVKHQFDSYLEVYEAFSDDKSRQILSAILLKALSEEVDYSDIFDPRQYFAITPFVISHRETFIDAGAYCGDTIEQFITIHGNRFTKIFAFEPSKANFTTMGKRMSRLIAENNISPQNIVLSNSALGEKEGTAKLLSMFLPTSRIVDDCCQSTDIDVIPVTTIDEVGKNNNITLIAADIEGAEMQMLRGGKVTIQRDKPKLALSVYHRPDDLFLILSYCKSIHSDYKFSLRHHYYTTGDTVLYCY